MAPAAQQQPTDVQLSGETNQEAVLVQKYLTDCRSLYSCIYCRTHLANHDELMSRSFQGNRSRAYLFHSVINVSCGVAGPRQLNTGRHAVADIFCANCRATVGWKYEGADEETQKYKVGKYIIELAHVVRENRHLELDKRDMYFGISPLAAAHRPLEGSSKQEQLQARRRRPWRNSAPPRDTSLSPSGSSSGQSWSSPSSSSSHEDELVYRGSNDYHQHDVDGDDDDDEEFMFPLYDDLMSSNQSSYSNSSAMSRMNHNKLRRSLYSESTPYDWKYSTTSPSSPTLSAGAPPTSSRPTDANNIQVTTTCDRQQQRPSSMILDSSLCSSAGLSSPSTSSSMSAASSSGSSSCGSGGSSPTQGASNKAPSCDNEANVTSKRSPEKQLCDSRKRASQFDNETQFECDVDDLPDDNQSADQMGRPPTSALAARVHEPPASCSRSPPAGDGTQNRADGSQASTTKSPMGSRTNSLSLDDEEFYDCNTEHDVQQFQ